MLSAYFLPLWHILLDAPQYPEGLEMKIWLHGLSGNIGQINGLNHYIGMKFIVAGDFKEFKFLPYIFGALTLIGFTSANRQKPKVIMDMVYQSVPVCDHRFFRFLYVGI